VKKDDVKITVDKFGNPEDREGATEGHRGQGGVAQHLIFSACHHIIQCWWSSGILNAAPPISCLEVVGRLDRRQPGHAGGLADE
jgi:hypothetical protein